MNTSPLVSVIIPVYNVLPYLGEALDSVVNQTYRNLEIIVIDDGSTDGSGKACDEYERRDPRIHVVHQENQGLSAARNAGIELATEDYLVFLDPDDWLEPNAIEVLLLEAVATDADVVCCQYLTDKPRRTRIMPCSCRRVSTGEEALYDLICSKEISTVAWAKLYRTEMFEEIRFPSGRVYEDLATIWRILDSAALVVNLPTALFHHRVRRGSISDSHTMSALVDRWTACKERYDALGTRSDEVKKMLIWGCMHAIGRTWSWYLTCSIEERRSHAAALDEMATFAKEHTSEILRGCYPFPAKVFSIACRWRNPFVWGVCMLMNSLRRLLRNQHLYVSNY